MKANILKAVNVGKCLVHGLRVMGEQRQQRAGVEADPPGFQEVLHEALARRGIEVHDLEQLARDLTGESGVAGAMRGVATSARVASRIATRIEQGEEDTLAVMQETLDFLGHLSGGPVVVRPTGGFRPEYAGPAANQTKQRAPASAPAQPTAASGPPSPATRSATLGAPPVTDPVGPRPSPSTAGAAASPGRAAPVQGQRSELATQKRAIFLALEARVQALETRLDGQEAVFSHALTAVAEPLAEVEDRLALVELRATETWPQPVLRLEDMPFETDSTGMTDGAELQVDGTAPALAATGSGDPVFGASPDALSAETLEPTADAVAPEHQLDDASDEPSRIAELSSTGERTSEPPAAEDAEVDELDLALEHVSLEELQELERNFEHHSRRNDELRLEGEAAIAINRSRLEGAEARLAVLEAACVHKPVGKGKGTGAADLAARPNVGH